MKFTVSKRFSFEAAHSLPHLPTGHKCRNLHGHSYVVEVFCSGPLDERGFVVDYADISRLVDPHIANLDHRNLNEVLPFITTAENIGQWFDPRPNAETGYPCGRYFMPLTDWPALYANIRDDRRGVSHVRSGPWLGKPSENLPKTTNT